MATLTETAYYSRKFINIGIILLIVIVILRILVGFTADLWQKLFPPPPPPATVAFGKLPYPNAQNDIATPSAMAYTLETVDGKLPILPANFKVYFMPSPAPSFGSFDKMKKAANNLGFSDVPKKISSTAWQFANNSGLTTLQIDELSLNFHYVYNFVSDLSVFSDKNFSSNDQAIGAARSFLGNAVSFPDDLQSTNARAVYLRYDSGALLPATSLSGADAISVIFDRSDIDKTLVVPPDYNRGLVSALISGSNDQNKRVLDARFLYTPVSLENWATYPLIKSSDAFTELKAGRAILASLPSPTPQSVTIRKVYVAFLDPYPPQNYLQPVLVFSDEKGFLAYVPLIKREWLQ